MAGDEEVEAVARAIWDGMVSDMPPDTATLELEGYFDGARAAIATLDRVRSRSAGGTEGEDDDKETALDRLRGAAPGLTDRVVPSPAGGAEGEDHAIGMGEALVMARLEDEIDRLRRRVIELEAAPSPADGTEPDTDPAVLHDRHMRHVELLRQQRDEARAELERLRGTEPDTAKLNHLRSALERVESHGSGVAVTIAREALAEFSVDAGKAEAGPDA
jgi:hypothetical protein